MRNGTSTVWLLAMETQLRIAVMLVPISSLIVIVSATLRLLPLQTLSFIAVLEMRSENPNIWLLVHLARGKGINLAGCCYTCSPTFPVKKVMHIQSPILRTRRLQALKMHLPTPHIRSTNPVKDSKTPQP